MTDVSTYDNIFQDVGQKYGIDPLFLKAHAEYESGLDPKFKSPGSSASGIAAFTDATAKDYKVDREDPYSSIDGQARYLVDNYKKFKDSKDPAAFAISAYKTGPSSGTYDDSYVNGVLGHYQKLKQASLKGEQAVKPMDEYGDEGKLLGLDDSPAPAKASEYEQEEKLLGLTEAAPPPPAEKAPVAASSPAAPVSTATPAAQVPAAPSPDEAGPPPMGSLSGKQLTELRQKDPKTYEAYMARTAKYAMGEVATGLGDVPRSAAKALAWASPSAYTKTATALSPMYEGFGGSPLPKTPEDLTAALAQRNADFEQQYGKDPGAGFGRGVGQMIASAPAMGAVGKVTGALADSASPALQFLGGKVGSNAVINPLTGALEKASTFGNKLLQYGASGLNAAGMSVPWTAATAASNNEDFGSQLKQNAITSGTIGAAGPAIYDAAAGAGNMVKGAANRLSSGDQAVQERAQSVLNQLAGGPAGKLDLTEYVPGSRPTLAEAAVENPNLAALHSVLREGNPTAGGLVIPEITARERENDLARRSFLDEVVKTPEDMQAARETRKDATNLLLYGSIKGEGGTPTQPSIWQSATKPADVKPVVEAIDNILAGPNKKNTAVVSAMQDIKNKLVDEKGVLENDPETLYRSVIKDINDKLDKATPMDAASQNMQAAAVQVKKVKDALNASIKQSTPGYETYLQTYHQLSQPVDEMKALQKLNFLSEKSDAGVPTLAKVNNALDAIVKKQNSQGFSEYDSISDEAINKLQLLQHDLQRKENPQKLLRIVGSPTDPKIAARKKVEELLGPPTKKPLSALGAAAGAGLGGFVGEHWLGGPGMAGAAGLTGEEIGRRGGATLENMLQSRSKLVKDRLTQMMLSPETYSELAPEASFLKGVGERPVLQQLLRAGVPLGVVEHRNNLLSTPLVSGAGNSQ